MSRSRRRTPIRGITCAESEQADKAAAHRRLRRIVKSKLEPAGDLPLPEVKEVSNPWAMAKDGKRYFGAKDCRGGPGHSRLMKK